LAAEAEKESFAFAGEPLYPKKVMGRRDIWSRDELLLALDLYFREGTNASPKSLLELSNLLRQQSPHRDLVVDPSFRSPGSVGYKLANFAAFDPAFKGKGATNGGRGDLEVWTLFAGDHNGVADIAKAIRGNLPFLSSVNGAVHEWEDDEFEAPEGRVLTRAHQARERDPKLARRKKESTLRRTGQLECEACGFDFVRTYGGRGHGFIECHHIRPLSMLRPDAKTKLTDLALLCSNCHRMIHRGKPWLSVKEITSLIHAAEHG